MISILESILKGMHANFDMARLALPLAGNAYGHVQSIAVGLQQDIKAMENVLSVLRTGEIQTGMTCRACGGDVSMYLEYGTNGDDAEYDDLNAPGVGPQVTLFCPCQSKVLRGQWSIRAAERS